MANPKPPAAGTVQLQLLHEAVAFDAQAYDAVVAERGVTLLHYISLPCASGQVQTGDIRSAHENCSCSNGRLYFLGGSFKGIFTSVRKNERFTDSIGVVDDRQSFIICSRFYQTNGEPEQQIYFSPYDRIVVQLHDDKHELVSYWQRVMPSANGVDIMDFPVEQVTLLVDALNKQYVPGYDFNVKNGNIAWVSGHEPPIATPDGQRYAYSIRFLTKSVWLVSNVMHEIRSSTTEDLLTGDVHLTRFPMFLEVTHELRAPGVRRGVPNPAAPAFPLNEY